MDSDPVPRISALDFARAYAGRSGLTLWQLAFDRPNREVRECHCDYEGCEGWQLSLSDCRLPGELPGVPVAYLALVE